VAVMIVAFAFATGFQNTISKKIFSFWGHIRVQHYELGKVAISEETAINKNDTVEHILQQNSNVIAINAFATKSAVVEHQKEIEGILIKGIDTRYDSNQLKEFLLQGRWLRFTDSTYSKEILLSETTAKLIKANVGDTIKSVFINSNDGSTKARKMLVVGIFKTGVEEIDKTFAIADLRLIQHFNEWDSNKIGGYEVFIKDYKLTQEVADVMQFPVLWNAKSLKEVNPTIFDWLGVMDTNRNIVFAIMAIVAIINLITCLLILVLERVKMVGILKALGCNNVTIQKIFLYYAAIISATGVGIGCVAGVGLCLLQQYTHLFKMNEENYYVAYAPVEIVWWHIAAICIITFVLCFVALILPTLLIKKVEPVKAIAFK
jgi:lipoprotein-releasing system permease protein